MRPAQTPNQLKPGDLLDGKYRILDEVGSGGFGTVYVAENVNLGTRVAIKVRRAAGPDDRLWREGKAAASLQSPHTVRVFDVDQLSDGTPYMVMEFLAGQSLSEYLRRHGALSVSQAVGWTLQLCAVLREAHAINLVHRDLKPSNVFVVDDRSDNLNVKLVDFGLAKKFCGVTDESVTESGMVVGSPAYMSPEQVRSAALSPLTDIWSLGVVLYEMLSGSRPFQGASSAGTLAAIAADPPIPLSAVAPHVPVELERIVLKCLRKTEAERFASIDELSAALQTVRQVATAKPNVTGFSIRNDEAEQTRSHTSSLAVVQVAPTRRSRRLEWAAFVAFVSIVGALSLRVHRSGEQPAVRADDPRSESTSEPSIKRPSLAASAARDEPSLASPTVANRASTGEVRSPQVAPSASSRPVGPKRSSLTAAPRWTRETAQPRAKRAAIGRTQPRESNAAAKPEARSTLVGGLFAEPDF